MKSMTQKFLALSLLISLPGCFDFGCCKKDKAAHTEAHAAQAATPKEHCSHAGCTHGHGADLADDHVAVAQPCSHAGCTEKHAHDESVEANVNCGNAECTHGHKHHDAEHTAPHHEEEAASEHMNSDEK